jgi:hypothetical protein
MPMPTPCRAVAFFDVQKLYHYVHERFGYTYPNFDPTKLAQMICGQKGWQCSGVRVYTGVPLAAHNPLWHNFWTNKLAYLKKTGVYCFSRDLKRYVSNNASYFMEKGVDVRIAIDIIMLAIRKQYDVALVFSQDQDLSEAAAEIRAISAQQQRWIHISSAYPESSNSKVRGINRTDWIPFSQVDYDSCIDPRDYR